MIPMDELGPGKFSHRSNLVSVSVEHTLSLTGKFNFPLSHTLSDG